MSITDKLNIARKVNVKRLKNSYKVWRTYHQSRKSGTVVPPGYPLSLSVEPTTACNLRCPECPSGLRSFTRPTGSLSLDLFDKLLEDTGDYLMYLLLYFQGEPFIHKSFFDLIKKAKAKNIYTATSTNAHFLTDENAKKTVTSGLDRLIISIDGTTQETYEAYRKEGTLSKVIDGAKNVLHWKKKLGSATPHVVFQFLVVRPNEHQIPEVYRLARQLGVDEVSLKSAQVYDYKKGNSLIPTQDKYSRYRLGKDGLYHIKNGMDNHCWKMWHSCVMTWDGRVVPCCFDKDAHHIMGDMKTQSFHDIWYGNEYQRFRKTLLTSRDKIEMCRNCTEGTSVSFK